VTGAPTLMEFGWSFVDIAMSNPADCRMQIGSAQLETGSAPDDPSGGYRIQHDSLAEVLVMLRGACTLRSVMAADNLNAPLLDKMLLVTLDGTSINPRPAPPAIPDGPARLNWYVDQVDIAIGFKDPLPAGLERLSDVPSTSSLKGQSQSSISTTLSVGFFGQSLTASLSRSWSHSFGIQLQDFGIERTSTGNEVTQHLRMEMSKSATYAKPEDLIDGRAEWPTHAAPPALQSPPDAAITNLDIPTQCLYRIPGSETGTATLQIRLVPRFVMMRIRPKNYAEETPDMQAALKAIHLGVGDLPAIALEEGYDPRGFPYNMTMEIEIATPAFVWEFPVDFSKVGAP
jgi:hypothetical protein